MQQGIIVELHMNLSFGTNLLPFHIILPTFHPKWMSCHEHLHLLLHQQFRWPVGGLSFYYQETRGSLQFYRLLGLQEDRFHAHLTRSVHFRYSWSGETSNLMEKHTYNSCIHQWVHWFQSMTQLTTSTLIIYENMSLRSRLVLMRHLENWLRTIWQQKSFLHLILSPCFPQAMNSLVIRLEVWRLRLTFWTPKTEY